MTICRDCDSRWTGLNEAHCASCHRTFGGITGFDKHKVLTGGCLDLATLGMTEVVRVGHTCWVRSSGSASRDAPWVRRGSAEKPDSSEPALGEGDDLKPSTALLAFSLPTVAPVGEVA